MKKERIKKIINGIVPELMEEFTCVKGRGTAINSVLYGVDPYTKERIVTAYNNALLKK